MRRLLLVVTLLTFISSVQSNERLRREEKAIADETLASRVAADRQALNWEAHVQKLNSEVLPHDHYSHNKFTKKSTHSTPHKPVKGRSRTVPQIDQKSAKRTSSSSTAWHVQTADQVIFRDNMVVFIEISLA